MSMKKESKNENENYILCFTKHNIKMKDRKTRIKEIWDIWYDKSHWLLKTFWKRSGYWGEGLTLLTDEIEEELDRELDEILERNGYNEIFKQHVMAYRIINRWKSARVNPRCELGRRKMEHDMISAGI